MGQATSFWAALLHNIFYGKGMEESLHTALQMLRSLPGAYGLLQRIEVARQSATRGEKYIPTALGQGTQASEAIPIALFCALTRDSFIPAVLTAVNHGGHRASLGALTGQLAGLLHGLRSIPAHGQAQLQNCGELRAMGDRWQHCPGRMPEVGS